MKFRRRQSPRRDATAFVDDIRHRTHEITAKASGERIRDRSTFLLACDAQELMQLAKLVAKTTTDLADLATELEIHGERLSAEYARREAEG